jgi:hypothetical protein
MAFVDIGVGTAMLYGAGIGAAAGGIYAGVTGKNVLNGALIGGAGGALLGGGAAGIAGASWGGLAAAGNVGDFVVTAQADAAAQAMGYTGAADAVSSGVSPSALGMTANAGSTAANTLGASQTAMGPVNNMFGLNTGTSAGTGDAAVKSASSGMTPYLKYGVPAVMMAYGSGMFGNKTTNPGITQQSYVGQSQANPNIRGLSPNYQSSYPQSLMAAEGGIMKLAAGGTGEAGMTPNVTQSMYNPADVNAAQSSSLSPATQSLLNQYGITAQQAQQGLSALQSQGIGTKTAAEGGVMGMAHGGSTEYHLGSYSDGGRLLKGPGDGMSDEIPATIAHKQPARLAEGEFVVPADVVSHLGNGSTDAGAKHLYKMMDNVRHARTGKKKQAKQIKAEKFLPKN